MKQKLIFLDIDGTLVTPGKMWPSKPVYEAIKAAQAKGHKVFLCSGRNMAMLDALLPVGFDGIIASAGGHVRIGEEILFDHPMPKALQADVLATLQKSGVLCTLEAKDATFGDSFLKDYFAHVEITEGNSELARWKESFLEKLGIKSMEEYDGRPIYKIVFMCEKEEQLAEAKAQFADAFHFCFQSFHQSKGCNGELISREFNKGSGIQILCAHLGADLSDTIGIGDSMNDYEMIETVGYGICMENGAAALKEISDYVCPAVEEDGVAVALKKLGLC